MNSNLAYKEELREERLGGRTVAMSPRPAFNHNRIASRIYWLFENYLNGHICTAIGDGTDLYLSEEDRFEPTTQRPSFLFTYYDGLYILGPWSGTIRRCGPFGVGVPLWVWA